jgi:hypothetical protein
MEHLGIDVHNLAENRSTESEAGSSQTGLDVKSRFTEGRISESSVAWPLLPLHRAEP